MRGTEGGREREGRREGGRERGGREGRREGDLLTQFLDFTHLTQLS